ncbi:MAG: hypothetical protein H0W70_13070 [Actinobacteria bacterium]|nr:hypothetical protein [Actinomycetota bacterium]
MTVRWPDAVRRARARDGVPFPVALLDSINRSPEAFAGGADDRGSWIRWLLISLLLCPILVGYGIVLGYYWAVVKRTGSMTPRTSMRRRD